MSDDEKFTIPEELEEWIGLKKSEYLSVLIENQPQEDFGFDEFHLFDHLIPDTVEGPDRSFEDKVDGRLLQTFIRTYSDDRMYYHVVLGSPFADEKAGIEAFLLVLSFVTRSEEVVKKFSTGQARARPTMN